MIFLNNIFMSNISVEEEAVGAASIFKLPYMNVLPFSEDGLRADTYSTFWDIFKEKACRDL
jgi:hypothetical protein